MWKFKLCPRCGGDIFLGEDIYGYYEECLQCSYMRELNDIVEFKRSQIQREQDLVQVVHTRPKKEHVNVS